MSTATPSCWRHRAPRAHSSISFSTLWMPTRLCAPHHARALAAVMKSPLRAACTCTSACTSTGSCTCTCGATSCRAPPSRSHHPRGRLCPPQVKCQVYNKEVNRHYVASLSIRQEKRLYKVINVVDLSGFGRAHLKSTLMTWFKQFAARFELYYPEVCAARQSSRSR